MEQKREKGSLPPSNLLAPSVLGLPSVERRLNGGRPLLSLSACVVLLRGGEVFLLLLS